MYENGAICDTMTKSSTRIERTVRPDGRHSMLPVSGPLSEMVKGMELSGIFFTLRIRTPDADGISVINALFGFDKVLTL